MARELKRVDFYDEPEKKKDTKEERQKYFIIGFVFVVIIAVALYFLVFSK